MSSENIYKLLTTLSLIVILVGIVTTEYYYIQFGIKYQFLEIPFFHLLYRGITAIYSAWYLIIIYISIGIWLSFIETNNTIKVRKNKFYKFLSNKTVSILLISLAILVSFPVARGIGISQAKKDLNYNTCTLPELLSIEIHGKEQLDFDSSYRLLNISQDYIVFFIINEKDNPEYTKIPTFWLNKNSINKIKLRK